MSKYIIEIEDEPFGRNDNPVIPHGMDELYKASGFNALVFDKNGLDKLTPLDKELDEAYQRGLNDAWDCAKRIVLLKTYANRHYFTNEELEKIFGYSTSESVFYTNSASEAIEKIKAYEEQQKVEVGDWVFNKRIGATSSAKVTCVGGQKVYVLYGDGSCGFADMADLEKTNVRNPKVEQLLEMLKGEQRNCSACKHDGDPRFCDPCRHNDMWQPKEGE